MKKWIACCIMITGLMNMALGQDFILGSPSMTSTSLRDIVTFEFRVTKPFQFSNDDQSNNYATISIGLGDLKPSGPPTGTGAALFNWVLNTQVVKGRKPIYTWVGTTKEAMMLTSVYKISIDMERPTGNSAKMRPKEDVMVVAQFVDPGNAPSGKEDNNVASAVRSELIKI